MGKHLAQPVEQLRQPPIWRTKIALPAVLMLTVVVITILGFRWLTTEHSVAPDSTFTAENADPEPFASPPELATGADSPSGDGLIVHVAGAVHNPGIVELDAAARVVDAIDSAGGPTNEAQLDALNLAAMVSDGEYILVPDRDSVDEAIPNPPSTSGTGPTAKTATVNLNSADAAELETLPGVGPATAEKIINHRERHGAFGQLADLEAVSGIGPATLERLEGFVTW